MSQQINLYNAAFEKKERPFSLRAMGVSLALVGAGVVSLYSYAALQTRSAERTAAQLGEQLKLQREQLAQLAKLPVRTPSKALAAEIAKLEAEVKARQTSLQALGTGELGNAAGFSEFLAALGRQAVPGIWLTRVTISDSGNELLVQGRALRAELMPAFLRALNKEPVMRGRRVTELKLAAKGDEKQQPFIEFSLSAPLQLAEVAPQ
jgi:Tfp pilus assembly protein PilN